MCIPVSALHHNPATCSDSAGKIRTAVAESGLVATAACEGVVIGSETFLGRKRDEQVDVESLGATNFDKSRMPAGDLFLPQEYPNATLRDMKTLEATKTLRVEDALHREQEERRQSLTRHHTSKAADHAAHTVHFA